MIICDSREQKNGHILRYFEQHVIPYKIEKMEVADYQIRGNDKIVVDRKQNLDEVASNLFYKGKTAAENNGRKIPSDVARFWKEVRRAFEHRIKMVVLVEHGNGITELRDIAKWNSSHSGISGRQLMDKIDEVQIAYGIKFMFCDKSETPRKILDILGWEDNHGGDQ